MDSLSKITHEQFDLFTFTLEPCPDMLEEYVSGEEFRAILFDVTERAKQSDATSVTWPLDAH